MGRYIVTYVWSIFANYDEPAALLLPNAKSGVYAQIQSMQKCLTRMSPKKKKRPCTAVSIVGN